MVSSPTVSTPSPIKALHGQWRIILLLPKLRPTILLVDDDAETLDTWAKGLEECCNYTVLKADTVKSALDVCRDQKMDCVVLDLDMDDASGFEVLLALVPDRKHRQIAVVVLTRLINPVLHNMAVEYGAQACLVKQRTSPELLDQAIKTAIASTQGHAD